MSDFYIANMKEGGVYEANSQAELQQRIARHYFDSDKIAIVNIDSIIWFDNNDDEHVVNSAGLHGIEVTIQGMIQALYLARDDGFSTSGPVRL